jgi:hypothetical protein
LGFRSASQRARDASWRLINRDGSTPGCTYSLSGGKQRLPSRDRRRCSQRRMVCLWATTHRRTNISSTSKNTISTRRKAAREASEPPGSRPHSRGGPCPEEAKGEADAASASAAE